LLTHPSNIDLKKLRAFQMVARHGRLQSAAARLHVTMSAVSIQIKTLESGLGVQLLHRVGRRLVLTPSGEVFLKEVEAILDRVDRAIKLIRDSIPTGVSISIAIGTDLTRYFSTAIARFVKRHPEVGLSLRLRHSPDTVARLLEEEIDMVVGHFGALPAGIVRRPLLQTGFSVVYPPNSPLVSVRRPSLRDIGNHCLILPRQQSDMGQRIMRVFAEAGITPKSVIEAGNCQSSRELAEQGIGVAIVHSACLNKHQSSRLRKSDVSRFFGHVNIVIAYRKSLKLTTAHQELLRELETSHL
jgi:DNA-binding transcriptional LysR family regulator